MYVHNEPIVVAEASSGSGGRLGVRPCSCGCIAAPHPAVFTWFFFSFCSFLFHCRQVSSARTTPSSAVHRPISLSNRSGKKNEIFVDILERLTVLFNSNVRSVVRVSPGRVVFSFFAHAHMNLCLSSTGLRVELHY